MPGLVSLRRLSAAVRGDPSSLSLLGSNLVTLVLALVQGWDLATMLWVYWGQSVIIGFFAFLKILTLPLRGAAAGPATTRSTSGTVAMAVFFAVHYGLFHFVYSLFLKRLPATLDRESVAWAAAVFFFNHLFSFLYNVWREREPERPGEAFRRPYARIIPMHLTILLGFPLTLAVGANGAVLALFLLLKTYVDLQLHAAEHRGS
ncbi:MAG TPA: DUF6498-containing protein [Candidatus Krumholzibacteria bacterium]|nr:DUF6498-containing protein [Candidatus Krumholzibacteria bacterium]HPD73042.1 DUF6498-containing protein [Candidatus Krumholzibacteria bacterium]HRY41841.1 DUF6498-containing protein [Candidatus Krumholzibacteria bacterium]